jgi:hypothetical protein
VERRRGDRPNARANHHPPALSRGAQRGIDHYLATGEGPILNRRIEISAIRRDGTEFPVELTVAPARSGTRVLFNAFIRDLTEQKAAGRRLAAEHAVTRVVAESHTLHEAAPRLLQVIGESLHWPLGVFWVMHEDGERLCFAGCGWRPTRPPLARPSPTPPSPSTAGRGFPAAWWERASCVGVATSPRRRTFRARPRRPPRGCTARSHFPIRRATT